MTVATSTTNPPSACHPPNIINNNNNNNNNNPSNSNETQQQQIASVSTVYFVDDRGHNPTIRINPSARVSISNDPLKELLLKKSSMATSCSSSITQDDDDDDDDDDDYSDEEFDNDSIRQLEWECLEKDLTNVLNGIGDDRSSTCSARFDHNSNKDQDEAFYL